MLPYDFPAGRHSITVRATSADGEVQAEARTTPFPSGSTGWHSIQVVAAMTTPSGLPAGPRLVPAPAGDATPDRPRGRRTTRPRQCGRTDRTRSTIP